MNGLSQVDQNFKVETKIDQENIRFYPVLSAPIEVRGLFYENGKFRRIPEDVAKCVSERVHALHAKTAGGRLRFRTDSPYVAIHAKMSNVCKAPHMTLCASAGFDLYVGTELIGSFVPPMDITDGYEALVKLKLPRRMHDVTIHFPLYSDVDALYVGLDGDAALEAPLPYRNPNKIVYYGSSITQGGCASRPGSCYQAIINRRFDVDYLNLGFSGSAKGESAIADYIKHLPMSVFVYDYDHNAYRSTDLEQTHERMFLEIREANPNLPIVMMSRPRRRLICEDDERRLEIIRATYQNALARGDQNVYLIDGATLMQLCGDEGLVDGIHPTDLGFFSMANALIDVLKDIL